MDIIRDVLAQGIHMLSEAKRTSAPRDAQVLLGHVLDLERSALYAYPERLLTAEQAQQFRELIERRRHGEPVAYLIGHKEFYGLDLFVDRRVLIPRPETELLVETALSNIRSMIDTGQIPVVADIGTGSGAIPIALAVYEPLLPYLYASDISRGALEVAELNCRRHHVEQRVHLLYGDLLTPLPEPVNILTANLPYVGTDELEVLTPDVRDYEPPLALFSGPYGLDLLQRLLTEAKQSNILARGAIIVLEIGYQQRALLTQFLHDIWPQAGVAYRQDYAGWDRVLQITLPLLKSDTILRKIELSTQS